MPRPHTRRRCTVLWMPTRKTCVGTLLNMRGVCGRFFVCWGYEEQKALSSPAMTRHDGSWAEGGTRMLTTRPHCRLTFLVVAVTVLAGALAQADIVTDWSITAASSHPRANCPPVGLTV
jgi:hypothetical protein